MLVDKMVNSQSTYCEDDTTDGRTSLGEAHLSTNFGLGRKGCVTNAVVVVEATEGHLIEIVEFHFYFYYNFDYDRISREAQLIYMLMV